MNGSLTKTLNKIVNNFLKFIYLAKCKDDFKRSSD